MILTMRQMKLVLAALHDAVEYEDELIGAYTNTRTGKPFNGRAVHRARYLIKGFQELRKDVVAALKAQKKGKVLCIPGKRKS